MLSCRLAPVTATFSGRPPASTSRWCLLLAPTQLPPYEDAIAPSGLVKYAHGGTDPDHSDHRALRTAMQAVAVKDASGRWR